MVKSGAPPDPGSAGRAGVTANGGATGVSRPQPDSIASATATARDRERVTSMQPSSREIARLYDRHPLRMANILARVRRQRRPIERVTEIDLAMDQRTEITDQNNIGGAAAVIRLGREARISSRSRVLDLGCGLGGPARLLAHRFGCRVDGIDLSATRVREATALTRLAGLSDRVVIRRGDLLRARVPSRRYDIIWGQSAWIHIDDKASLMTRWRPALRRRGRMVVQDSCLRRLPANAREAALLSRLERDWAGSLVSAAAWRAFAAGAGLTVTRLTVSSRPLRDHFRRLERAARRGGTPIAVRETRSWHAAIAAAEAGLIARFTLIAHV
jgi:SAM-dependent methyltransferase